MTATDELKAMLAAVLTDPEDDTVRLVYADRLQERDEPGDAERAEFIRVEIELAAKFGTLGDVKYTSIQNRLRELHEPGFLRHLPGPFWVAGGKCGWSVDGKSFTCGSRRGFTNSVACTAEDWMKHADTILAQHPVTAVTLTTIPADLGFERNGNDDYMHYRVAGKLIKVSRIHMEALPEREMTLCVLNARWPGITFTLPPEPV